MAQLLMNRKSYFSVVQICSTERFVRDICEGNHCFICGISPTESGFNDEHILPDWILDKFQLYQRTITLPNQTTFRYDQYKIPCCKSCNELMGTTFETPISQLIHQGFNAVDEHLKEGGSWLFFRWMSLIYTKTHLKDRFLRMHQDRRKGEGQISDYYEWEDLHHIFCVARSFFSKSDIDPKVHGSLIILPASEKDTEQFDYLDLYHYKTTLLRLNDVAFITVFTDSTAVLGKHFEDLKIQGPLNTLQLREIAAHFAYSYSILKNPPSFHTKAYKGKLCIEATLDPMYEWLPLVPEDLGQILHYATVELIEAANPPNFEEIKQHLLKGEWSFFSKT